MDIERYKVTFIVVTAIITLLVASPALQRILVYPQTEFFTELWLLGPNHKAENYPYNITNNGENMVYLGISNHLGYCGYYVLQIKLRNQTQLGPDSFNKTASPQPSLYNISLFVADNQTLETQITFKFNYNTVESIVYFNSLTVNGVQLNLNGYETSWNSTNNDYYCKIIFELWLYNSVGGFQYNSRYVDLRLNMTS